MHPGITREFQGGPEVSIRPVGSPSANFRRVNTHAAISPSAKPQATRRDVLLTRAHQGPPEKGLKSPARRKESVPGPFPAKRPRGRDPRSLAAIGLPEAHWVCASVRRPRAQGSTTLPSQEMVSGGNGQGLPQRTATRLESKTQVQLSPGEIYPHLPSREPLMRSCTAGVRTEVPPKCQPGCNPRAAWRLSGCQKPIEPELFFFLSVTDQPRGRGRAPEIPCTTNLSQVLGPALGLSPARDFLRHSRV
jgi:hypothetical protein